MAEIRKVAVIGCGLMGSGIAEVSAKAGYDTMVREVDEATLEKGLGSIRKSVDRAVGKGKLEESARDEAMARIRGTTALEDLAEADLVVEAIVENLDVKKELFGALDRICHSGTILASNTSSLTVTEMAAATARPDRFVGLHFFNPVPVMKLVEVVRTIATGEEAFRAAYDWAASVGKEPVEAKDASGFIVNRLLVPYMLDAIRSLEQGLASIEDIDKAMVLGTGYPMGPFTLSDFVGIDTLLRIAEIMVVEYAETRFAPPPLLRRMVTLGRFGRKSGRGFYDYSGPKPVPMKLDF
ncbi:MAG TPA: 3-hydroxybutyryl-CoA dehydrogenase [Longimicrobiales bacterium]|nr:3-hydroxybutyryl-CoA dehydrogenase [Longimicrobiales bacterium]